MNPVLISKTKPSGRPPAKDILTANSTTPYVIGFLNLQRMDPLVIDYPKGTTAGGILDFWQRLVTDLGLTGPPELARTK